MSGFRGGIIAAGHGERLKGAARGLPKPMVRVAGLPLVAHAIGNLRRAGAAEILVLLNSGAGACVEWLRASMPHERIEILVRDTASSFESFCRLAARLNDAPALVTTVDGIIAPPGLRPAADALARLPGDGLLLGLTTNSDDEKPLWVEHDPASGRITRIGGAGGNAVTAGVYGLPAGFAAPRGDEFPRLRDYLADHAASGRPVTGVMLGEVIDVDRPSDVAAAERRLAGGAR
jgi:NDP-sugar pyrophosphorylase family protein